MSMVGEGDGGRPEEQVHDPELARAVDDYLTLARGDLRLALEVSVADSIATARLVSRGYARWRQPRRGAKIGP